MAAPSRATAAPSRRARSATAAAVSRRPVPSGCSPVESAAVVAHEEARARVDGAEARHALLVAFDEGTARVLRQAARRRSGCVALRMNGPPAGDPRARGRSAVERAMRMSTWGIEGRALLVCTGTLVWACAGSFRHPRLPRSSTRKRRAASAGAGPRDRRLARRGDEREDGFARLSRRRCELSASVPGMRLAPHRAAQVQAD